MLCKWKALDHEIHLFNKNWASHLPTTVDLQSHKEAMEISGAYRTVGQPWVGWMHPPSLFPLEPRARS